jgi:two-component system, NtrC family, response regulator AtoC
MPRLLLVDDDRDIIVALERYFVRAGFAMMTAANVAEGIARLEEAAAARLPFDAVITDLNMPDGNGLAVLRAVRRLLPACPTIVLSGAATVAVSVEAMRLGALTLIEKPAPPRELERQIRLSMGQAKEIASGIDAASSAGLIGSSPQIRALFETVVRVAQTSSTVLVEGESGTGKERVAQSIHRFSSRATGPFVAVNCAAIPETLLESELFGHVKGAFTGAAQDRRGRFQLAEGGTLFLDEIGEMPLAMQGKLLRVLEERTVEPVGSAKSEAVDFRLVAATNRKLEEMVAKGQFRADLFYRLNVVPLSIPPLRERRGDVAQLAEHFLAQANAARKERLSFGPDALAVLERHAWPGNVRELKNLVERLAVLKDAGAIGIADLPDSIRTPRLPPPEQREALPASGIDLHAALAELEDRLIGDALQLSGGNKSHAATMLGLKRTTLIEKLKRRGKPTPR